MTDRMKGASRRAVLAGAGLAGGAAALTGSAAFAKNAASTKDLSAKERRALLSNYALNVEIWWPELSFEKRFEKAAQAGFSAIEMWPIAPPDRDAAAIGQLCKDNGLRPVQCTASMSWKVLPLDYIDQYKKEVEDTIEHCGLFGCDKVTVIGHQLVEGMSHEDMIKRYTELLAWAAPKFEAAKLQAIIEPFNAYNHPGHFLYGSQDAVNICREIDNPYMKINWDLFHMQRSEGNVVDAFRKGADQVGYVQLADSPDRKQPGTGEMDYAYILREVRAAGYKDVIGLECWPIDDDTDRAVEDVIALAQAFTA